MPHQPRPVAVPIASYIGQHNRVLAIRGDCLNVATLNAGALVRRHGQTFATADLKPRLRCGRCAFGRAENALTAELPRRGLGLGGVPDGHDLLTGRHQAETVIDGLQRRFVQPVVP